MLFRSDLEQIAPGRYRGRFPTTQEGVYLVGMAQRAEQRAASSQVAGLVVPYAEELRDLGLDEGLLKELADLTGGSELTAPQDAFLKGRRPIRVWVDAWPWIAGLCALLLLMDIAIRRFGTAWMRRRQVAAAA